MIYYIWIKWKLSSVAIFHCTWNMNIFESWLWETLRFNSNVLLRKSRINFSSCYYLFLVLSRWAQIISINTDFLILSFLLISEHMAESNWFRVLKTTVLSLIIKMTFKIISFVLGIVLRTSYGLSFLQTYKIDAVLTSSFYRWKLK